VLKNIKYLNKTSTFTQNNKSEQNKQEGEEKYASGETIDKKNHQLPIQMPGE
jgi:hypothetical protein